MLEKKFEIFFCFFLGMISASAAAQNQTPAAPAAPAEGPTFVFTPDYMGNAQNITKGQGVWFNQCRHCHGNSAYPGKAPKLNPAKMEPDFIYDRVTNGFRKMPPWKGVFSAEELQGVVAYIKSKQFSP
jgi:mono/diheme cytochrome c family protein